MKRVGTLLIASFFVLLQGANALVHAETLLPASVVINEIQTNGLGSGTTLQEFIEIVNASTSQVDIGNYKVVYTNSSGKDFDLVTFGIGTTLNPSATVLLVPVNPTNSFLPDISPKLSYIAPSSSGMAASGGKVSLINANAIVLDSVQWTSTQANATDDVMFFNGDGKSLARKVVDGSITVSASTKNDFETLAVPTPQSGDTVLPPAPDPTPEPDPVPTPDATNPPDPIIPPEPVVDPPPVDVAPVDPPPTTDPPVADSPPAVETPQVPISYAPILLNELYIDPVSPETDANDEWVEVYNPNAQTLDLGGYAVFTGTNFSYKYVFPAGTTIAANGFIAVTSGATPLSLSNGGGAAKIIGPDAQVFDTVTYSEASAGQAWAKNSAGVWVWTTTPSEEATNVITSPLPPVIKAAAVSVAKAKKATASTSSKVTAVKAATTKAGAKPKTTSVSNSFDDPALIAAPMPIPVWLLAVLISLAVLYVGYEYRFEAANSLYRFKKYRSTRR